MTRAARSTGLIICWKEINIFNHNRLNVILKVLAGCHFKKRPVSWLLQVWRYCLKCNVRVFHHEFRLKLDWKFKASLFYHSNWCTKIHTDYCFNPWFQEMWCQLANVQTYKCLVTSRKCPATFIKFWRAGQKPTPNRKTILNSGKYLILVQGAILMISCNFLWKKEGSESHFVKAFSQTLGNGIYSIRRM